ncbi:DUF58 domain-containing protein [Flavihumibacter sp. CACIAM 22H1]|uniref:DUF58 domain-containing protein n=1 Tax=Flavihumibacter sp. CACIAM 22H1 TaxID=1812911 RepID=UPI0007A88F0E|nr:DUF58 domain-containing protein [Flavihumibacter sp. CACIAM 22H1]KYP15024.1 MAG: cell division protein FtsB [Flavihumibacter sp. CACIAM 22H1]
MPVPKFIKQLYITNRLVWVLIGIACFFILTYFLPVLFEFGLILLGLVLLLFVVDILLLFRHPEGLQAKRKMADIFSNGDDNKILLELKSAYPFAIKVLVMDEVPVQFQYRNFQLAAGLKYGETAQLVYYLKPLTRGEYWFGAINCLVSSPLALAERRFPVAAEKMVMVWPSFHSLRSYELLAHNATTSEIGSRKVRKLGHSLEFEEIKEYVPGDDLRNVNWKATARKGGALMVNNFMDERSQQVYCLIDKSRVMKMPFEGMTLLDYAINASLVLSRVALVKYDKAGLICFDENRGKMVPADRKGIQMSLLAETLYRQQTNFLEADYEKLVTLVKSRITHRSLLILFTNFESMSSLQRQLPYIRSLAKQHLLLVVFFENTALQEQVKQPVEDLEQLYIKTITEKFIAEKRLMVKELQKYGIQAILTSPQQLTTQTINKYLELKARQII